MVTKENNQEEILSIAFNQDQGCFACGTETGFRIFNSFPFKETFSRDLQGGIGIIEMLYRCNILALVGGGKNPKYPTNKVILWDDHQIKAIGEMSFRSEVKAVKLMSHRVVVVLDNKIFVYNFSDLKLIDHIETCPNPKGLCALNTEVESTVLACPDKLPGHVIIHLYDKKRTTNIKAHQSALSSLELNSKGTKLATASEKGTIIRIYSTEEGKILQELRRGSEYAQIYSLTFDPSGRWIACSSDSGTIHIFSLKLSDKEKEEIESYELKASNNNEPQNPKSKFSFMKIVLPYFDSEWSFAQFRVPDMKTKVAFGSEPNTIIVASYDGNYYQATLNPSTGGECQKVEEFKLFAPAKTV